MADKTLRARNPRTGLEDYVFAVDGPNEVAAACRAVRAAQPRWQALGIEGRTAALRALTNAFSAHADSLHHALATDTGRERIARVEVGAVQGMIASALRHAPNVLSECDWTPASTPGVFGRQRCVPYPLVGVIAPWNFPVVLSMIDTIPALAAGCGVVLKPSEITPRYVEPLRKIFASVPELADVLRIVRGPGDTGAALIEHVDAVVCTGSVRTGRIVAEHAARRFIPAFLELGGKDAVIITRDANLERAATAVLRGSVLATGQACQSLERIYIDRQAMPKLLELLCAMLPTVKLTANDPRGNIGPFIMARQAEIVRAHIDDAVARGAQVAFGGNIIERGGVWCEPTLLTHVNHTMRVMREETFGPVMPVMPFDSIDEAIALANDSEYGLSANVFAADEDAALAIARHLDAGFISIDDVSMSSYVADFEWEGFRFSGLGRSRMAAAGVERYCRRQTIAVNRGPTAPITALTDT